MRPNPLFLKQSREFWALIKYVSEQAGYTVRKSEKNQKSELKILSPKDILEVLDKRGLSSSQVSDEQCALAAKYIKYRAQTLSKKVEPMLMSRSEAKSCFQKVKKAVKPSLPIPMNRQRGEKRHEAYLTAMVSMLAENTFGTEGFVNDPQRLAILTENGVLKDIFSRRFDGVIPDTRNPIAVWEVKEYYGTTTFGSRVADGVYETLLDGFEIREMGAVTERTIKHFLFVDGKFTWWNCGKSYLCRIIDMLHTGHVDEVFFGRQVATEWPATLRRLK